MGKTPYQAAMEAADEIGLAVIATTFTLIAVFLPTAFMTGLVGRFFKQFGWTAAIAVFASLVVARMLTPMMAAYDAGPTPGGGKKGRIRAGCAPICVWFAGCWRTGGRPPSMQCCSSWGRWSWPRICHRRSCRQMIMSRRR